MDDDKLEEEVEQADTIQEKIDLALIDLENALEGSISGTVGTPPDPADRTSTPTEGVLPIVHARKGSDIVDWDKPEAEPSVIGTASVEGPGFPHTTVPGVVTTSLPSHTPHVKLPKLSLKGSMERNVDDLFRRI